jgi:hypothetical protein
VLWPIVSSCGRMTGNSEVIHMAGERAFREKRAGKNMQKKELCHKCDAKPVLAAQIDFLDEMRLLILWKLQKTKERRANPAYRLARYFFQPLQDPCGWTNSRDTHLRFECGFGKN